MSEEVNVILRIINDKKYRIAKEDAEQVLDWLEGERDEVS
jgi:hypothetical protein